MTLLDYLDVQYLTNLWNDFNSGGVYETTNMKNDVFK